VSIEQSYTAAAPHAPVIGQNPKWLAMPTACKMAADRSRIADGGRHGAEPTLIRSRTSC